DRWRRAATCGRGRRTPHRSSTLTLLAGKREEPTAGGRSAPAGAAHREGGSVSGTLVKSGTVGGTVHRSLWASFCVTAPDSSNSCSRWMPSLRAMDLRQLAALTAVADAGSFSAAARRLHTVQSNVSTHVARLERELGTTLVDRSTGELTEEGEAVVARSRRIQHELEALEADVSSMLHEVSGP